jgi:hypothetical protein
MKKVKILRLVLIFMAITILFSSVFAEQPEKPAALKEFIASLEKPIILRGDFLKAAQNAYQNDFSAFIMKKQNSFLSSIENYDLYIEKQGNNIIVNFAPTIRNNAPEIFGGGARYTIDSRTFLIKEKLYTK